MFHIKLRHRHHENIFFGFSFFFFILLYFHSELKFSVYTLKILKCLFDWLTWTRIDIFNLFWQHVKREVHRMNSCDDTCFTTRMDALVYISATHHNIFPSKKKTILNLLIELHFWICIALRCCHFQVKFNFHEMFEEQSFFFVRKFYFVKEFWMFVELRK